MEELCVTLLKALQMLYITMFQEVLIAMCCPMFKEEHYFFIRVFFSNGTGTFSCTLLWVFTG